jgi:hypothetical protein
VKRDEYLFVPTDRTTILRRLTGKQSRRHNEIEGRRHTGNPKRPGLKLGARTEFPVIGDVIPGHENNSVAAYPQPTVQQVKKALAVERAFEQVLETPGAAEVLKNPVLKPLLDLASA